MTAIEKKIGFFPVDTVDLADGKVIIIGTGIFKTEIMGIGKGTFSRNKVPHGIGKDRHIGTCCKFFQYLRTDLTSSYLCFRSILL